MAFGWKVVRYYGDFDRAYSAGLSPVFCYIFGQWKVSGREFNQMAVFRNYNDALYFKEVNRAMMPELAIYPCEYLISSSIPFWASEMLGNYSLPLGTVFADAVRIF